MGSLRPPSSVGFLLILSFLHYTLSHGLILIKCKIVYYNVTVKNLPKLDLNISAYSTRGKSTILGRALVRKYASETCYIT